LSSLKTWVISQLRKVTGLADAAEEHVDMTRARRKRDASDLEKLTRFFTTNSPFCYVNTFRLVSLSTSIAATEADEVI